MTALGEEVIFVNGVVTSAPGNNYTPMLIQTKPVKVRRGPCEEKGVQQA